MDTPPESNNKPRTSAGTNRLKGIGLLVGGVVVAGISAWVTYASYQASTDGRYTLVWGPFVIGVVLVVYGIGLLLTGGQPLSKGMKKGLLVLAGIALISLVSWAIYSVFQPLTKGRLSLPTQEEQQRGMAEREEKARAADIARGMIDVPSEGGPSDGAWHVFDRDQAFPSFLDFRDGKLFHVDGGVAFEGRGTGVVYTREGGFSDTDFLFEVQVGIPYASQVDTRIHETWVGMGLAQSGDLPSDSMFMQIVHPLAHRPGEVQICYRGSSGFPNPLGSEPMWLISESGSYYIRVEKLGPSIRFAIGTRSDQGFVPLGSQVLPDPKLFYGDLNLASDKLFVGGASTFQKVRLRRVPVRNQPSNPRHLELVKAEYGSGNRFIDVTPILASKVKDQTLFVRIGSDIFPEDPAPHSSKEVKVQYAIDGASAEAVFGNLILLNPNEVGWDALTD